jgi:hypothetical protein
VAEYRYWYNNIVLNAYVLSKIKSFDTKKNFCDKLRNVFNQFLEYHTKIMLADLNSKLFSNQDFVSTLYMKHVTGVLRVVIFHVEDEECNGQRTVRSHTKKLTNMRGLHMMGRPTSCFITC